MVVEEHPDQGGQRHRHGDLPGPPGSLLLDVQFAGCGHVLGRVRRDTFLRTNGQGTRVTLSRWIAGKRHSPTVAANVMSVKAGSRVSPIVWPHRLHEMNSSIHFANNRQTRVCVGDALRRTCAPGAGPGSGQLVMDLDSTIGGVCGGAKYGARCGNTKKPGYHPLLAARPTQARCSMSACARARPVSSPGRFVSSKGSTPGCGGLARISSEAELHRAPRPFRALSEREPEYSPEVPHSRLGRRKTVPCV